MTGTPDRSADAARLAFALAALLAAAALAARGRREDAAAPLAVPRHLVDVNRAPAAEIEAMPGVGPVLAARIVGERARGRFLSAGDLGRVPGVGPATIERMRPFVRCGSE